MEGSRPSPSRILLRRLAATAFFAAALSACSPFQAAQRMAGGVLVQLGNEPGARERLEATAREQGLYVERELFEGRLLRLQGEPRAWGSEEEIARRLVASGRALAAEPDAIVPLPEEIPTDESMVPLAVSRDPLLQWHHARIRSNDAWTTTTGSPSVRAAVCDSGFDVRHPDLRPNLALPGYDVVGGGTEISGNAHGTMTAGALAARGGNGIGVSGAAWSASIMPIKVSQSANGSASYSALSACIDYASSRGARVINLSYGGLYASSAIEQSAAWARARGALVVIAAGNDSRNLSSYQNSGSYLLVGATDSSNSRASFSNWGAPVDLAAPGAAIMTTVPGGYRAVNGTSFSAPIVSGVAALIFSLNPSLTPGNVEYAIMTTAVNLGSSSALGRGLISSGGAVSLARSWRRAATP